MSGSRNSTDQSVALYHVAILIKALHENIPAGKRQLPNSQGIKRFDDDDHYSIGYLVLGY